MTLDCVSKSNAHAHNSVRPPFFQVHVLYIPGGHKREDAGFIRDSGRICHFQGKNTYIFTPFATIHYFAIDLAVAGRGQTAECGGPLYTV